MHQMSRKNLTRFAGIILSILCLAFFFVKARSSWNQVGTHIELEQAWTNIALALIPYMLAYAIFASSWHLLMRALGDRGNLMTSWGIFLTAQFGKYLPGNIGHHAGRIAIGMKHGKLASQIVTTMVIETLMTSAVAGLLGLSMTGLVANSTRGFWAERAALPITMLVTSVIITLFVLTLFLTWRRQWMVRLRTWLARNLSTIRSAQAIRLITLCAVLTVVALSLSSTPLLFLSTDAPALTIGGTIYAAGLFCAAWIAGMLTPGAPAGLGVREAILVQGLAPLIGQTGAVITTILFRVLTVAADLLALVAGIALLRLFPGVQAHATRTH
jgi:hypothetical protein